MTCPRCGAIINGYPCSNCGFPETLKRKKWCENIMDKYRQERVKRLQKYVSEQGLDAMLVTSQDRRIFICHLKHREKKGTA